MSLRMLIAFPISFSKIICLAKIILASTHRLVGTSVASDCIRAFVAHSRILSRSLRPELSTIWSACLVLAPTYLLEMSVRRYLR